MALKQTAIALLLLALAGCASVDVQQPAVATSAYSAAFLEAQSLAQGHAGLTGAARSANAGRIESLLAGLDDAALARDAARLPAGDPLYSFAGRALLTRGLPLPRPFDRGDASFGAADRPAADRDGYRPPMKVGVLLPLSGGQSAAAASVRDGFLAGYYGERRRRPELRFYDTAAGASAAYARAAAEGNDFVVGPLARDEVDAVFADETPSVPLLALNRGSRTPPVGSAAFSLSPEDEGISIAQYLIQRGAKNVLVIQGGDDAQRRIAAAARTQLQQRGVRVAASLDYREDMVLDGIVYPTETWGVRGVDGLPSQASAAARVDTAKGPAARLFAFGYDAWLLTGYLERLALSNNGDIAGATGRLSLDGFGNVLRVPGWSRFAGGVPVPLADGAR